MKNPATSLAHRLTSSAEFRSGLTGPGAIDPGSPGFAQALLDFHRDTFGQARMMANPPPTPVDPAPPAPTPSPVPPVAPAPEPDRGFPPNTATADMTTEQQLAYWKFQSRKHEDAAKALAGRADYDDVKRAGEQYKTELEALRQAQMTESEKALAAARAEGAQAAKEEATASFTQRERDRGIKLVDSFLNLAMGTGGRLEADRDRVAPVLKALDKTTFLTGEGDVDTDALNTFVNSLASPAVAPARQAAWSAAQGRRESPAAQRGVDAGRELFEARRGRAAKPAAS